MSIYDNLPSYISGLPLSKASMTFNGIRLETEIPGFRVHTATGRDTMEQEVEEIESKIVDGTFYRSKRLPPRDIEVEFVLIRNTVEDLHKAYTKLKGILYSAENAQIEFNDENDVYYIGTVTDLTSENIVLQNDSQGTFTIHCADPFKYGKELITVNPDSGDPSQFTIAYDGTYRAYPILEADFLSDCGFIGFTDGYGVLQFGDPDELDKGYVAGNRTENILQYNRGSSMTSANIQNLNTNTAVLVGNLGCVQNGRLISKTVNKGSVPTYDSKGKYAYSKTYDNQLVAAMNPQNMGTYTSSAIWVGSGIQRIFNADSQGKIPAKEFYVEATIAMDALKSGTTKDTDVTQCGMMQFVVSDNNNRPLLGMVFLKNNQSAECEIRLYAGNTELLTDRVSGSKNKNLNVYADSKRNKYLFWDHGTFSMSRIGDKVDFYVDHRHHSFNIRTVPALAQAFDVNNPEEDEKPEAYAVNFFIGRLDTRGVSGTTYGNAYTMLGEAYIRGFAALKYKVSQWADIPNKFSNGNKLEVNTKEGTIELDSIERNDYGAIGNEWDTFCLRPGNNIIRTTYSHWATRPDVKIKYRKVFI